MPTRGSPAVIMTHTTPDVAIPAAILFALGAVLTFLIQRFRYGRRLAEATAITRSYRMISGCDAVLVRSTTEDELMRGICQVVVTDAHYPLAFISVARDNGSLEVLTHAGDARYLRGLRIQWRGGSYAEGPSGRAVRLRSSSFIADVRTDKHMQPWRGRFEEHGFRSSMALFIDAGDRCPGYVLSIYSTQPHVFGSSEVELLNRLAADLAFGLKALHDSAQAASVAGELKRSEEMLREITESMSEVFWIADIQLDTLLYVTPAYEAIWGRKVSELYADRSQWLSSVLPEDRPLVEAALQERASTHRFDLEYRILRPDGELRWIHERAFPVKNEAGSVYRVCGICSDITAMKGAQARLH